MSRKNRKQSDTPKRQACEDQSVSSHSTPSLCCPTIVGIGASAGGLSAFEHFFDGMPSQSNLAFVLIQHLGEDRRSLLAELVDRHTGMDVREAEDGVRVEPDCVYTIPPGKEMAILHGKLHLMDWPEATGIHLPIDSFFRSLAQDMKERAVGILLSGTGSDGTQGLKAIKSVGGMVMVQDPESAEYDGMPRSALETGLADYVLRPKDMGTSLTHFMSHPFARLEGEPSGARTAPPTSLKKVFIELRRATGHDFTLYKPKTISRRIERRMAINQIAGLDDYHRYLRNNPSEVEALFRELLISVTSFFRDPDVFDSLEETVAAHLATKDPDHPIRVWIPGCATGEEAYSIAMILEERLCPERSPSTIQIFATDISSDAIAIARAGIYPEGIANDVSPERLKRHFEHDGGTYKVRRRLRDMIVFAEQNVISDPPFSRLDLISCRNLLIYLEAELQRKLIPMFHYALLPEGFLLLGTSESPGPSSKMLKTVDKKNRIYQRADGRSVYRPPIAVRQAANLGKSLLNDGDELPSGEKMSLRAAAEETLLKFHTPACVIANDKGEGLFFHGRTGKYLEPAPGEASNSLMRMAREGLKLELPTAIRKAVATGEPVRYSSLPVDADGNSLCVDLTVTPLTSSPIMKGLLLVVFEDVDSSRMNERDAIATESPGTTSNQRITRLEKQLRTQEEYLQTSIEELEASNEELRSTNEELQSSNEELQSTIEELETSKEESQSMNEELTTVNHELEQKIQELSQATNDINNLLSGTNVGTIFLNQQLRINRFTPSATKVVHLIQSDVGRPIGHVVSSLQGYDELSLDAERVLNTLIPIEKQVRSEDGIWYLLRVFPYRTLENVIDGVVLTFVDVSEVKLAEQAAAEAKEYADSLVETVREPLEDILPTRSQITDFEVEHSFPSIGKRTMLLNAREVKQSEGKERLILLAMEDITDRES